MNVLDLFSGIGGFSLGLERAGMRTVAFCEIEPYCCEALSGFMATGFTSWNDRRIQRAYHAMLAAAPAPRPPIGPILGGEVTSDPASSLSVPAKGGGS